MVTRAWTVEDKQLAALLQQGAVCFRCGGGMIVLTQGWDHLDSVGLVVSLSGTEEEKKELVRAAIRWQKGNLLRYLRYTVLVPDVEVLKQNFRLLLHSYTVHIGEKSE